MKNLTHHPLLILVMVGLIWPAGAIAQITNRINFSTTFPFTVGNTKLPAGSYTIRPIENEEGVMEISSADGKTTAFFETMATDLQKTPAKGEIVFKKYGDSYLLGEIYEAGVQTGAMTMKTHAERQLEKKSGTPTRESVTTTKATP
ncbi:MAG: hypothetical protein L0220_15965 [Acidobacteria bacterium]|nr:hypothetical protein [Acidobacteriota bacterium]